MNPFYETVTFSAAGISGTASIEIYNVTGHLIIESDFTGSYCWSGVELDGSIAPSGVYLVRVVDQFERKAGLAVTRLSH
ncbi:MAG: T9SS type A sorting domain-containing protein [Candidatus Aegiribacteria sp.]|nr:T9SS type A sorting domain-containing protein [Candidatus Aegiribacteria sp.]